MGKYKPCVSKEISWLAFNDRVLQEAADKNNPLIERMRFLGIYSSNLEEFYKVRVADLRRRILIYEGQSQGEMLQRLLKEVKEYVRKLEHKFDALYNALLIELARNQIFLVNEHQLTDEQQQWLKSYFTEQLSAYIKPIVISPDMDLKKFLKDDNTYLAVDIKSGKQTHYALLEIVSNKLPRFITLPSSSRRRHNIILLDNVMRYCLHDIFAPFFETIDELHAYAMKMTRDAEYDLVSEVESSLLDVMSSSLKQRLTAKLVRFVYQREMPKEMVAMLCKKLSITDAGYLTAGGRYYSGKDFIKFPNIGRRSLEYKPLLPVAHTAFDGYRNVFDAIRHQDILLYYPYHSFDHVLDVLLQAACDPGVVSIKINIYRVARNSQVIDALIHAACNGKKVIVMVELQARFDEEANILWAKCLTEAGVQVLFSAPGFKVHAKLFLITRREGKALKRYAHVGTGNFNESTAKIYTDYSLLTADERITEEVHTVFRFLEMPYYPVKFDHLIVSPQNSRETLYSLIDQEIQNAAQGKLSGITLKINNLVDDGLIERLYAASNAGVTIDLLIRGMCSLVPQQKGLSENIRVISILDRYLEHDRVYIFENNGNRRVYISSADWMTRNIENRVEVAVEIMAPHVKKQVLDIVGILFSDNTKARIIDKSLSNHYLPRGNHRKVRGQLAVHDYIEKLVH